MIHTPSNDKPGRSRRKQLSERLREHESLVAALQGGEVDAVVVLQKDQASIARLQSDEPLYRTIVDSMPQGVATVLSDGTIVYLNGQLATLIGGPVETLRGSSLLDVIAEVDRPRLITILQQALTKPQEGGLTFRWASGDAPALVSAIRLPCPASMLSAW